MKKSELIKERDAARTEALHWYKRFGIVTNQLNAELRECYRRLSALENKVIEAEGKARDWCAEAERRSAMLQEESHISENRKIELEYATEALERSLRDELKLRRRVIDQAEELTAINKLLEHDRCIMGEMIDNGRKENDRLCEILLKRNNEVVELRRRVRDQAEELTAINKEVDEARRWARKFYARLVVEWSNKLWEAKFGKENSIPGGDPLHEAQAQGDRLRRQSV